tara:strand:- start:27439 stop:28149 length:711 start_codon:yes stop_codon:yes gene_type:complete
MELGTLTRGRLLRRYKRFLADVELDDGQVITAHCPNTGAMTGCAEPGFPVWLAHSESKTRKYPFTWELVETPKGLACIHSVKANKVVGEALAAQKIPGLEGCTEIRTEVKYGSGSRVDFVLAGCDERIFIEVKCVTLCREEGQGVFPDAVSDRGRKHLLELSSMLQPGTRAMLLFCVFHNGIQRVSAAGDIDPRYRDTLAQVMADGVEVIAWRARVSKHDIQLSGQLPFSLDPVAS